MIKHNRTNEILMITPYKKYFTFKKRNASMKNDIIYYRIIWKEMFIINEAVEVEEHNKKEKHCIQNLLNLRLHKFKGLCNPLKTTLMNSLEISGH